MTPPLITLTTDFGERDSYVAQVKGVLLSRCHNARLLDLSHCLPPQDIRTASRFLCEACLRFPPGTIHLAVIDPGVGTARSILVAETEQQFFVLPDNGLLTDLLEKTTHVTIRRVDPRRFNLTPISNTFHGRDLMAPAAAELALGRPLDWFGHEITQPVRVAAPRPRKTQQGWHGEIVHLDHFGNAITNLHRRCFVEKECANATVRIQSQLIHGLVTTYGEGADGEVVALFGSSDWLEIAVVNGSAAELLNLRVGTTIEVQGP